MTGSHVKDYDGKNILLQDGQTISSATVLWAAGVKGNIPDGVD
jgi:NADH dehydrogenase